MIFFRRNNFESTNDLQFSVFIITKNLYHENNIVEVNQFFNLNCSEVPIQSAMIILLFLSGFIWGVTNPLLKRASNALQSPDNSQGILKRLWYLLKQWQYLIPQLVNLSGSVIFFIALSRTGMKFM